MTLNKITFLTVPPLHALLYGDMQFEGVDSLTPPLGLLQLAAYVRQYGYLPAIVDGYAHRYTVTETLQRLKETEADVFGSDVYHPAFHRGPDDLPAGQKAHAEPQDHRRGPACDRPARGYPGA